MDTNALIIEYSRNPPNKGILEAPTVRHRESNRICADIVEVFLRIEDGKLEEFSFDGYMSIIATAVTAIVGEALIWEDINTIITLDESFIKGLIWDGISPRRRNASLMWLLAIRNAIHIYKNDGIIEDFLSVQIQ
jgi:nitrogen fixation protein NifU and related proteins